ncbi:MAG: hypothetical protein AAB383_04790 [Patescibacteria group bacterium]
MRLSSNDDFGLDIKGNGVFTEDPNVLEIPEQRPLVRDMPELAVVQNTPEVPTALDIIRERVLIIGKVPVAPARSGFGRKDKGLEENN